MKYDSDLDFRECVVTGDLEKPSSFDPAETLQAIRVICAWAGDDGRCALIDLKDLAGLVIELDAWLQNGGEPPLSWLEAFRSER